MRGLQVKYWRKASTTNKYHACFENESGQTVGYMDNENMFPIGPEVLDPPLESRCKNCQKVVDKNRPLKVGVKQALIEKLAQGMADAFGVDKYEIRLRHATIAVKMFWALVEAAQSDGCWCGSRSPADGACPVCEALSNLKVPLAVCEFFEGE